MSWADNLLDASFRGLRFDCVSTDDNASRATAEHSYPYKDGADIEDLGRGPRKLALQAVFWGDDYDARLQAFLRVLDQAGSGDLTHPVFGRMRMQVNDYSIHHDADGPDACTVNINFSESTPGNPFFERSLPAQTTAAISQHADTARLAAATVTAGQVQQIAALPGAYARVAALRETMNAALADLRGRITGYISSGLDAVNAPLSWAADISGALNSILDLRPFNADTMMGDWRAVFRAASTPVLLPSSNAGTASAGDSQIIAAHVQLDQALTCADAAGIVFAAEARTPTLTPPALEQIMNDVRAQLQAAIAAYRVLYPAGDGSDQVFGAMDAARQTAYTVQAAARAVLEARPPLISRQTPAEANLHLLAHWWYGDYTRAEELLRLNPSIRLPNDVAAGTMLNAYAE